MSEPIEYSERYVAFVDILGFRSLIHRAREKPETVTHLVSALRRIRFAGEIQAALDNTKHPALIGALKQSTFSDCVVLSGKPDRAGLHLVSISAVGIFNTLLGLGIFCRGAITRGKIVHETDLVLGEGMIEAYELERRTAVYPRIVFHPKLQLDLEDTERAVGKNLYRRTDFDGCLHLHVFHPKHKVWLHQGEPLDAARDLVHLVRHEINVTLETAADPSIRAKVCWLANYFNQHAGELGMDPISVAGGSPVIPMG